MTHTALFERLLNTPLPKLMAEAAALRVRATMGGRTVGTLLFVTVIAMAVARYL